MTPRRATHSFLCLPSCSPQLGAKPPRDVTSPSESISLRTVCDFVGPSLFRGAFLPLPCIRISGVTFIVAAAEPW